MTFAPPASQELLINNAVPAVTKFTVTFNGFGLTVGSNASLFLSAGPGGRINFTNKVDGDTAHIKLDNGTLDISGLTNETTRVGSIEGSGSVLLQGQAPGDTPAITFNAFGRTPISTGV